MTNIFEKLFKKKKKEENTNNVNQQTNINEQVINNQNAIQPEQPITFNQNMNVGTQTINPLGFEPTAPIENIQTNENIQGYNLNAQPTELNNQVENQQVPTMNINPEQQLNVMPPQQPEINSTPIMQNPVTDNIQTTGQQPIENQIVQPQPVTPSNEVNNIGMQQPITFNQEMPQNQPQSNTINVIPTMGPTQNPTISNQNNGNNQNM